MNLGNLGNRPRISALHLLFIASGLMMFLASPPYGLSAIAFLCLIPLLHAVRLSPSRRFAALGGFFAGVTFFAPGVYWLTNVTWPGYIALALYCASYFAVFAVCAYAARRAGPFWNVLVLAACWALLEVLRGRLITGFPWLLLSHTQYNSTIFSQVLDITGAYGLSGILAALNALFYASLLRRERRPALVAAAVFGAICVYGYVRIRTIEIEPSLRVASVQASVPQEMKEIFEGKYDPRGVLLRYTAVTESIPPGERVDLIVWPETVLLSPYALNLNPEALTSEGAEGARLAQSMTAMLARNHTAHILAGATSHLQAEYGYVQDPKLAAQIPREDWNKRYNSAYLLDPNGMYLDRYDKIHLVPFGEYIPLPNLFPFLAKLVPFTESLDAGEKQTVFLVKSGGREARFGVLICYEDLDPELARGLRRLGTDFLVNISNDAWFGTSIELDQHFAAARFRAIENRVGVVRSGNNGITGIIDPLGRVQTLLEKDGQTKDVTGFIVGEVSTSHAFSLYSRAGDWPLILICVVTLLYSVIRGRLPKSLNLQSG